MKKFNLGVAFAAGAAVVTISVAPAFAETTLKAVSTLQRTNTLSKSFLVNFVEVVNKKGKGNVQVNYLGGQEIVPPRKASQALKRGQFELMSSPIAYYIGTVPEGYAFYGSNQGPRALRKNGGWKLLQEVHMKKAGSYLLAWGENMTSYNTYMNIVPKNTKDGVPDLKGVKMRATGTYRPLFRALGASTINIKSSELFTAMQRGTVQGYGFPDVAVVPNGFHQVTKYRITPNYYRTNQVVSVNADAWKKMSKKQQDFMTQMAMEYETTSVAYVERQRRKEEKVLAESGVKDIALKGKAAEMYLATAYDAVWSELKKRSEYADQLKKLMYVPGKPDLQVDLSKVN